LGQLFVYADKREISSGRTMAMTMERQEACNLQDVHPEALLLATEFLGNLNALQMPSNIQNVLGNWLVLIGQILLVFNAQQQLWENGPGRCYSRCNKNIDAEPSYSDRFCRQADSQSLQAEIVQLRQRLDHLQWQLEQQL
jgi:hypothetical protein